MSIIHDALKKVQQEQAPKADESSPIFSSPEEPQKHDPMAVEHLPSKNKAKSILALLCSITFFLGSLIFCFIQMHKYLPQIEKLAKSSFYKLVLHKEEEPDFKTKAAKDLVPLAKITVNQPKPLTPPGPAKTSSIFDSPKPHVPQTLNIHGVMSNGPRNVVLIDDQVYQEGDEVDGVKIAKINLDFITVNNNGKEETIRVKN